MLLSEPTKASKTISVLQAGRPMKDLTTSSFTMGGYRWCAIFGGLSPLSVLLSFDSGVGYTRAHRQLGQLSTEEGSVTSLLISSCSTPHASVTMLSLYISRSRPRVLHSVNFTTLELRHPRSLRAMPLASSNPGDLYNLAVKTQSRNVAVTQRIAHRTGTTPNGSLRLHALVLASHTTPNPNWSAADVVRQKTIIEPPLQFQYPSPASNFRDGGRPERFRPPGTGSDSITSHKRQGTQDAFDRVKQNMAEPALLSM